MPKKNENIVNFEFEFSDVLKKARADRKLSMSKVTKLTGVAKGVQSQYENGIYEPTAKNFLRLCLFYNIPIKTFIKK